MAAAHPEIEVAMSARGAAASNASRSSYVLPVAAEVPENRPSSRLQLLPGIERQTVWPVPWNEAQSGRPVSITAIISSTPSPASSSSIPGTVPDDCSASTRWMRASWAILRYQNPIVWSGAWVLCPSSPDHRPIS